ncbi:lantibiotic dehydratase C-terminal domain-containing protein [Streptomyces nanhaiensis]|uniref:lantibiotic dehydratase C-terminal domain-containing protein n=1 Tax=Streptomyces nanhaiensis TaxID=679319 RepID=UPI00399C707C
MRRREWLSLYVYHADLDRLLSEAAAPLVAELRERGVLGDWFFLRYWEGGRHLRLRLACHPDDAARTLGHSLDRLRGYLAGHRAGHRESPEDYRTAAAALARAEGRRRYLRHLRPPDSVTVEPYHRERRYGSGRAGEAIERHFHLTSTLALHLVTAAASEQTRHTAALSVIALARAAAGQPVSLLRDGGGPGARLAPAVSRALELAERGHADRPRTGACLGSWAAAFTTLRGELLPEIAEGRYRPPQARAGTHTGANALVPLFDLCAHLACNRIGVTPAAEAALRNRLTAAAGAADAPGGSR